MGGGQRTEQMSEKLTISAEVFRWFGGRSARSGRSRVDETPAGFVVVTVSGRTLGAGDTFTAADGGLVTIPVASVAAFVRSPFRRPSSRVLVDLLLPVASALFGWLP